MSDIDTVVVDSLKALDPEWPIREADIAQRGWHGRKVPQGDYAVQQTATLLNHLVGGTSFYPLTIRVKEKCFQISPAGVRDAGEIERAISTFARDPDGGLIVLPGPLAAVYRDVIIALAGRHALPTVYPYRYFATRGGLVSYGIDNLDLFRRAASYVDRILKGEKAGDLPVQAPTKFELVINLKTAKTLGLDIPPMLLARADEVIE